MRVAPGALPPVCGFLLFRDSVCGIDERGTDQVYHVTDTGDTYSWIAIIVSINDNVTEGTAANPAEETPHVDSACAPDAKVPTTRTPADIPVMPRRMYIGIRKQTAHL